jgi:hypothetical protein
MSHYHTTLLGLLICIASPAWTQPLLAGSQIHAEAAPTAHPPPMLEDLEQWAFRLTQEDTYDQLILNAAIQWQLDPFLFKGLLYTESRLDPTIINKTSQAAGIAQFTAGGRRGITNLRRMRGIPPSRATFTRAQTLDPEEAIPAAAELLAYLFTTCKTTTGALMAYNSGGCRGSRTFVFTVFKHTNRIRTTAGMPPMPAPSFPARRNRMLAKLPTS